MDIERTLTEEFESQMEELSKMQVGTDTYKTTIGGVTALSDRILELKKLEMEKQDKSEARENEMAIKAAELEELRKDRKAKIVADSVKFGLVLGFALFSMYWEKTDTMTLSAGRESWKNLFKGFGLK